MVNIILIFLCMTNLTQCMAEDRLIYFLREITKIKFAERFISKFEVYLTGSRLSERDIYFAELSSLCLKVSFSNSIITLIVLHVRTSNCVLSLLLINVAAAMFLL